MEEPTLEMQFGDGMKGLIDSGLDFETVATETIRDVVGESPFVALLPKFDKTQTPATFVQRLATLFPISVIRTLVILIAKRAIASVPKLTPDKYQETISLIVNLQKSSTSNVTSENEHLLHDHRAEDELDQLVGHRTN
jgi:hypothetical protein